MKEIRELRDLLAIPLDKESGDVLMGQLAECEAWSGYVSSQYRQAGEELSNMKAKFFNPSLSSEDKRKIDLEGNVAPYQRVADELSDLQDIIKRRISLGQSFLSSMRADKGAQL